MAMNCESCGMPQGAYHSPGYTMSLEFMPQVGQRWTKQQKRTVWTCGERCAVQSMAIATMGLPTHKWHMPLREFISQMYAAGQLGFLIDGKRYKPISQLIENEPAKQGEFPPNIQGLIPSRFVTPKGGRPRVDNPGANARRQRRYRQRHPRA